MQPPAIILFIGGYYLLFVLGLTAVLYLCKAFSGMTFVSLEALLLIIFGLLAWYSLATAEDYLSTLWGINFIYLFVSAIMLYIILPGHRFKRSRTKTEKTAMLLILGILPMFFVDELWNLVLWGIQPLIIAFGLSSLSIVILYLFRSVRGYQIALMIISFLFYLSFTLLGISIGYSETAGLLLSIPTVTLAVATYLTGKTLFGNIAKE